MRDGQAPDGLRLLEESASLAAAIGATTVVAISRAISSTVKAINSSGGGTALLAEMTASGGAARLGEAPLLLNVLAMNANSHAAFQETTQGRDHDLEEMDVLAEEIGKVASAPMLALGHGLSALRTRVTSVPRSTTSRGCRPCPWKLRRRRR